MKSCISKLNRYNNCKIFRKLPLNETRNPCNINVTLLVSRMPRIKNWWYVEQALAYRISCGIYTPYAGDDGILLQYIHVHVGKEIWRWRNLNNFVCHKVESLVCRRHWISIRCLKYEADVGYSLCLWFQVHRGISKRRVNGIDRFNW
jgi:hypothetical protein